MDTTANGPTRGTSQHSLQEGARVVLNGTTRTVGELIALADGAAVPAVAPEAPEARELPYGPGGPRGSSPPPGHAVLARGLEEPVGFAGQAARRTLRATDAYAIVLACELVAAVRALRMRRPSPHSHPVPPPVSAFALATASLPAGREDRPLIGDVTTATELLAVLAEL
ncbi:hypothetical protein [Streptomyces sp. NBC_01235]|uniref:hypothetical protein n=1 Tax=Streptomyces sp. NBC_01235 TaxID=2903788 RepID=UPI002E12CFA2|nr:hypothetical protein OG289_37775 [Streptomyces sp. NBC_01235]